MISEDTTKMAAVLASIAPGGVRTAVRRVDARDVGLLFASERAQVAAVVDKRRIEFATGRELLRDLLGRRVAIPTAPNGAPIAPAGTTVTLAHDHRHAVAAMTRTRSVDALGIDVERCGSIDRDIWSTVRRPDEHHLDPTLVFVIKEASYKAWSAIGGPLLEFHDMRVEITGSSFRSLPTSPWSSPMSSSPILGTHADAAGHWLALAWIGQP